MFKIHNLILYGANGDEYQYKFESGLNYFKGKNSSGKTEFYDFIDYMFGSTKTINKRPWFIDSLEKATMFFEYKGINYSATRNIGSNRNNISYTNEVNNESIDLREYKERLNSIFAHDLGFLDEIRNFTDEDLTYRTFTMFNFLGEKRQGAIQDFLDKCSDVKYSIKLTPILNFIFNKNLDKIFELQRELKDLTDEVNTLEIESSRYEFILRQVNKNLEILGINRWYTGKNANDVRIEVGKLKEMRKVDKTKKEKNIAELEVMYSNITEQIKIYENRISDSKQHEKNNENRKYLLNRLDTLLEDNASFEYLIFPIRKIISELEHTISFNKLIIGDNTIKELRNQQSNLKDEIKRNDSRFRLFSLEEKTKAIILIEDYLSVNIRQCDNEIKEKRKRIREIREELKVLQSSDDTKKINELSQFITELYLAAKDISSIVGDDIKQDGFNIQYRKKGNILQPTVVVSDEKEHGQKVTSNYYIGSMARHTLIQLCGYLAFLAMLIKEDKYPLIPILVIDHISKPFDEKNARAIGKVITTAYNWIGKTNLQLFMFDDEEFDTLGIEPDHSEDLVMKGKSGFNPFYFPPMNSYEV